MPVIVEASGRVPHVGVSQNVTTCLHGPALCEVPPPEGGSWGRSSLQEEPPEATCKNCLAELNNDAEA